MRLTQQMLMPLFEDMNIVHTACLFFRIRCLAHRLVAFGWENIVNELNAREMLALAALLPDYQHDLLIREAYRKGSASIKHWVIENAQHLIASEIASGN